MSYLTIIAALVFVVLVIVVAAAGGSTSKQTHTRPGPKAKRHNKYGERTGMTPEEFAEMRAQTRRPTSTQEEPGGQHSTCTHIENRYSCDEQLIKAALDGDVDQVRLLLDQGANANGRGTNDVTSLIVAAGGGHKGIVELLIDYGADINARTCTEVTALYQACQNGHAEIAGLLLNKGANPNVEIAYNGQTPLYIAAWAGAADIVDLLLSHGANIDTPIDAAVGPLNVASKKGHVEVVNLLIERGADVNAPVDSVAPLYNACQSGHIEVATLLVEKGADVSARVKDGGNALKVASTGGYNDIARLLIKNGADVNAKADDGSTPIFMAAQEGHTETVELLIDNGARIDAEVNDGRTPLFIAAAEGHADTVRLLLDKGANKKAAKRDTGIFVIDAAVLNGHSDIVQLLEAVGEKPGSQDLLEPLAFARCNSCGACNWVKPDGTELVNADFEECGYIRYGAPLVCGSCGNKAILRQDCLLDADLEGKVRRFEPQSIWLSPDLSLHLPPRLLALTPEDEIGALFDLSALGASYGEACWRIVFKAVEAEHLKGCTLFCGDVPVRVGNLPYAFCIGLGKSHELFSDTAPLVVFVNALSRSGEVGLATLGERFIYGKIRETFSVAPCLTISFFNREVLCPDRDMFGWILRLANAVGWC